MADIVIVPIRRKKREIKKEREREGGACYKSRGMKNRGVDRRINRKHGRVSAFPVVGHDTGLPGVCTLTRTRYSTLHPSKFGSREFSECLAYEDARDASCHDSRLQFRKFNNFCAECPTLLHYFFFFYIRFFRRLAINYLSMKTYRRLKLPGN